MSPEYVVGFITADQPAPPDVQAIAVTFTKDQLRVALADGRELSVPLAWFPRLVEASPRERSDYELTDDGQLIHWPAVDEDIDVPNLLSR